VLCLLDKLVTHVCVIKVFPDSGQKAILSFLWLIKKKFLLCITENMIQDITMGLFSFLQAINALFRSTLLLQSYLSEHWKSRKSCYPVISETVRGTGKPQDWKYWRTDKCTPILADSVTCISSVKINCANYLIWNPNFTLFIDLPGACNCVPTVRLLYLIGIKQKFSHWIWLSSLQMLYQYTHLDCN
jgi:hypothetical protein